jgi:hypothetical protein
MAADQTESTGHMNEIAEKAHETIHEHADHNDPWARGVAVLVSALAAALAITEIGAKSTQNEYLTQHIAVSDDWAFYQARNLRATVRNAEAETLASLPNAADPAVAARIKDAQTYVERMRDDPKAGDGMKQLAVQAHAREEVRDAAFHRYHIYEYAAGALEIAIVLSSVSVVTRIHALTFAAGGIGGIAGLVALGVALKLL